LTGRGGGKGKEARGKEAERQKAERQKGKRQKGKEAERQKAERKQYEQITSRLTALPANYVIAKAIHFQIFFMPERREVGKKK